MPRKVVFIAICFISISGCALTECSDVEVQKQNTVNGASEAEAYPAVNELTTAARPQGEIDKSISAEYVTRIQAHLRKSGFYSGPVNGVIDDDTRTAIRHLQSVCVSLKDLIPNADGRAARSGRQTTAKINKGSGTNAVRLVQVRLKDAGFDPGPIDGIDGIKTHSALSDLQSGCMMMDYVPMTALNGAHAPSGDSAGNATRLSGLMQPATNRVSENYVSESKHLSREAIKALQVRLRDAGFNPGPIDGILGPKTRTAAQSYQSSLR